MKGVEGLGDFCLKNNEIHQLTTVIVMMHITVDDHWVLYAKCYGVRSTGVGRGVRDGVWVKISQNVLNYDVAGCQRGAL